MLTELLHPPARSDYSPTDATSPSDVSDQDASPEMVQVLRALRKKVVIGFVGGSDLVKIAEQLSVNGSNGACLVLACLLH